MSGSDSQRSLGEKLRNEREKRGITLEQVASATKISLRTLQALEADDYADLPAKPFVRGFLTSYARFVGLDPRELFTEFGQFIDGRLSARPEKARDQSGYSFDQPEGEQSRLALWMMMGGFLVGGALVMLVFKPNLKSHRHGHVEKLREAHSVAGGASPTPSPVSTPSPSPSAALSDSPGPAGPPSPAALAAVSAPSPSPSPLREPAPTASPSPVLEPSPSPTAPPTAVPEDKMRSGADLRSDQVKAKWVLRAAADVWVRFVVDQKASNEFILRKDRILVLKGRERIGLQVSNVESVQVSQGGGSKGSPLGVAQKKSGDTFYAVKSGDYPSPETWFAGKGKLPRTESPEAPGAAEVPSDGAASPKSTQSN